MKTVVYDSVTDEILRVHQGDISNAYLQIGEGESFLLEQDYIDVNERDHYVDVLNDIVKAKEAHLLSLPEQAVVGEILSAPLPETATVFIWQNGVIPLSSFEESDGVLDIAFDTPGFYKVEVSMIHYKCDEVFIHVAES